MFRFERLHPKPEWASQRLTKTNTPSLSSLLKTNKSFISQPNLNLSKAKRPPLPPGTIDLKRLRNANAQNPTTGKKEAAGAGNGVVGVEWHPNERLGVLAVIGGDRRVRMFNVHP
jgi:U3 small nucleolar RNA-associated protein 18